MGEMGQEKMGKVSKYVPFFSDFPSISYQFHVFFVHFPKCTFDNFSQFPILLHFPPISRIFSHNLPFPPNSAFSPFFHASAVGRLIRLQLTRKPDKAHERCPQCEGDLWKSGLVSRGLSQG